MTTEHTQGERNGGAVPSQDQEGAPADNAGIVIAGSAATASAYAIYRAIQQRRRAQAEGRSVMPEPADWLERDLTVAQAHDEHLRQWFGESASLIDDHDASHILLALSGESIYQANNAAEVYVLVIQAALGRSIDLDDYNPPPGHLLTEEGFKEAVNHYSSRFVAIENQVRTALWLLGGQDGRSRDEVFRSFGYDEQTLFEALQERGFTLSNQGNTTQTNYSWAIETPDGVRYSYGWGEPPVTALPAGSNGREHFQEYLTPSDSEIRTISQRLLPVLRDLQPQILAISSTSERGATLYELIGDIRVRHMHDRMYGGTTPLGISESAQQQALEERAYTVNERAMNDGSITAEEFYSSIGETIAIRDPKGFIRRADQLAHLDNFNSLTLRATAAASPSVVLEHAWRFRQHPEWEQIIAANVLKASADNVLKHIHSIMDHPDVDRYISNSLRQASPSAILYASGVRQHPDYMPHAIEAARAQPHLVLGNSIDYFARRDDGSRIIAAAAEAQGKIIEYASYITGEEEFVRLVNQAVPTTEPVEILKYANNLQTHPDYAAIISNAAADAPPASVLYHAHKFRNHPDFVNIIRRAAYEAGHDVMMRGRNRWLLEFVNVGAVRETPEVIPPVPEPALSETSRIAAVAPTKPIEHPSPELTARLAQIETRLAGSPVSPGDLATHRFNTIGALGTFVIPERFPAQPTLDISEQAYDAAATVEEREVILQERMRRGAEIPLNGEPGFQLPARTLQEQTLKARMDWVARQGSEEYQARLRINTAPPEVTDGQIGPRSLLEASPLAQPVAATPIDVRIGAPLTTDAAVSNLSAGILQDVAPAASLPRGPALGEVIGPGAGLAMGTLGIVTRNMEGGSLDRAREVGGAQLRGEQIGAVADAAVMLPDVPLAANALAQARTGAGFLSRGASNALGRGSLLLAAGWTAIEMENARQAQDGQREAGALYGLLGGVAGGAAGGLVTGGPWGMLIGAVGGGVLSSEYGRRSSLGDQMQRNLDRRAQLAVDISITRLQQMQRTIADGGELNDRDKADLRGIVPGLIEQYHRMRVLPLAETDVDGALRRDFQMRQLSQALQFIDPRTPDAQRPNLMPYTAGQMNSRIEGQLAGVLAQINRNPEWRAQLETEWFTPASDGSLRAADPRVPLTPAAQQRRRFDHDGPATTTDLVRLIRTTPGLDLYMLDRDGNGLQAQELMEVLRSAGAIGRIRNERETVGDAIANGINWLVAPEVGDVSPERRREYYEQLRRLVGDPNAPATRYAVEVRQGYEMLEPFVANERILLQKGSPPTPEEAQMQELLATAYFENYHGGDMASGLSTAHRAINRSRPLFPSIEALDRAGIGVLLTEENALRGLEASAFRTNANDFAHNLRVTNNLLVTDGIDTIDKEIALDRDGDGVLSIEEFKGGLTPEHQDAMNRYAPVRAQQIADAEQAARAALEARQAEDQARARAAELVAQRAEAITVTATRSDALRDRRARDLADSIRGQLSPELVTAMDRNLSGQPGQGTVQQGELMDFAREAGLHIDLQDRYIRRDGLSHDILSQLEDHRARLSQGIGTAALQQMTTEQVAAIDQDQNHVITIGELGRFMHDHNVTDANGQPISFAQLETELQQNNGQLPTVILEQLRFTLASRDTADSGQSR